MLITQASVFDRASFSVSHLAEIYLSKSLPFIVKGKAWLEHLRQVFW